MSGVKKRMKINHEETKDTKKDRKKKTFVLFVSSWLIFGGVVHVVMGDALK